MKLKLVILGALIASISAQTVSVGPRRFDGAVTMNARAANSGTDTGAANAYVLTLAGPAITAYADGQCFMFRAANANTAASTLAVSALAAKAIVKNVGGVGEVLVANDIRVGHVEACYDLTTDKMQIMSLLGNATPVTLGTAAAANTGTSGATLCFLNTSCTWSAAPTFNASPIIGSGYGLTFGTNGYMYDIADGKFVFRKLAAVGAILDFSTDSVVRARNRADNADASMIFLGATISGQSANAGQALCFKTGGEIGYCSTVVGASGACTCN